MTQVVIGAIAAAYCGFWLVRGLTGRRILDNLLGMIDRGDERYKVMVGAYAVGLAISVALIVLRL